MVVDYSRPDAGRTRDGGIGALALLSFAMLIVSLDQYIVVVALPDIGRDLGYSAQTLQLVISAYAVASSGFLLFGGRAADLLGARRMLVTGLVLYAVASATGGLATGPALQLTARVVQGLGGALVFPGTLTLINTTFAEGRDRNRALGVWGASGAAGLVIGVLLGGVLTRAFGWPAVFFVNVPLVAAALPLAFRWIGADPPRDTNRRFDLPGALTVTTAVTMLVFALVQGPGTGWASPWILGALAAGLLLFAVFAMVERRGRDPLLPPRLLTNRALSTAVVIAFLFMATFGSLLYFVSIFLQTVRDYDPLQTGVGFLLPTAVVVAGSAIAGRAVTGSACERPWSQHSSSARSGPPPSHSGCHLTAPTPRSCLAWSPSASATGSSSPPCSSPPAPASARTSKASPPASPPPAPASAPRSVWPASSSSPTPALPASPARLSESPPPKASETPSSSSRPGSPWPSRSHCAPGRRPMRTIRPAARPGQHRAGPAGPQKRAPSPDRLAGLEGRRAAPQDPGRQRHRYLASPARRGTGPPSGVVHVWVSTDVQPDNTPRRVRLGAGPATAAYPIAVPGTATHQLTVLVAMPAAASVAVWLEPRPDRRLPVVAGTPGATGCQPTGAQVHCRAVFAALDGEEPGVWWVRLAKRSVMPAGVQITVAFAPR